MELVPATAVELPEGSVVGGEGVVVVVSSSSETGTTGMLSDSALVMQKSHSKEVKFKETEQFQTIERPKVQNQGERKEWSLNQKNNIMCDSCNLQKTHQNPWFPYRASPAPLGIGSSCARLP